MEKYKIIEMTENNIEKMNIDLILREICLQIKKGINPNKNVH